VRVLAPDLLGHGESDKPDSGYLLHEHADGLAAFLSAVDAPPAALVGHSFGGAVAMQTAHQFPELVSHLVLVAAGGLGREVTLALRAATLPGAGAVVRAMTSPRTAAAVRATGVHRRIAPEAMVNIRRANRVLGTPGGRRAFLATLRGVIEFGGQRGSMIEMRRLAEHVPILLVWSERDPVIPISHAYAVQQYLPGSRLEVMPGATHEPHRRYADRFATAVADFVGDD
jgi:pimeloyl-ACP methyl ester carboxylesterase